MLHPEALIDYKIYEDKNEYLGIAQVVLPSIAFITQTLSGAGIAGNIESVLIGLIDAMTTTINFRSPTVSAADLVKPVKHQIDLRLAEQMWDNENGQRSIQADKIVLSLIPKTFAAGTIAQASISDANGEYSTYYYAAYKGETCLWEIDPYNYKCVIGEVDYLADVRAALGKN